jgi:hypothetical protein
MPTLLRASGYRFFFYSGDRGEPPHVHVERDDLLAKFWLDPVRMHTSGGLSPHEIRRSQRIIERHREDFLRRWHDYFDD